ncbi:MAG: TonB-dependent receptor, partial [Proteobacteria bacterium]|nr:TonB-dependent receptor [Pseudomonadota bacterium]
DDMSYNGLYGLLPRQYVASEIFERVEVLRGANAFIDGAAPGGSALGGAINLSPKRATNEPLANVTVGVDSGVQGYAAVDAGQRFGPDQAFGVRANVAVRDGDTAVNDEHRKLGVAIIGLDWRSRDARLSLDVGYQDHQLDAPRPSVTPVGGIPDAPGARVNFAQPWTYANERNTFGTLRGEYDFTPAVTGWIAAGGRDGHESNVLANPAAQPDGTTSAYRFDNTRDDTVWTGEVGVRGRFATGGVTHVASLVGTWYSLDSKNAYAFSNFAGFAGNLYTPYAVPAPDPDFFTGGNLDSPLTTQRTKQASAALGDVMTMFDGTFDVIVGARYQRIDNTSYAYDTGAQNAAYDQSRWTPALGVVWRVVPQWSLYANYMEGLQPGDVAPLTTSTGVPVTNGGEVFAPYRTEQEEVGAKYDGGSLGMQFALFQITKPSGALVTNPGDTSATFVVADAQRNRGAEFSAFGEPLPGFRVLGGISYIHAEMLDTGKDAIGVPDTQANVGVEWDVPALPGFTVGARVLYTSSQYADADNTLSVPAWSRLDVSARYVTRVAGRDLTIRGRIDNVTNENVWTSVGGYPGSNYLVLGQPLTFTLSATVAF